ncbi:hypothetical protein GGS20DRAFT_554179 [Poronia punctata]|nr:hypothetical protein GGS20DRAFT_554179 [Poronia punctata]
MRLDHANFARETEAFEAKLQRTRIILPRLPWYKRPECYAIIIGTLSLIHALFVQWGWPTVQMRFRKGPYSDGKLRAGGPCGEEL